MTRLAVLGVLAANLLIGAVAAASAQSEAAPVRDPKACAPDSGSHLDAPKPSGPQQSEGTTGAGESLSERLARSDGVICPPNVDPDIKAPTPDAGKMPVVPPPGSPGGDPSVQPK